MIEPPASPAASRPAHPGPDYDLETTLEVRDPDAFKAVGDPLRTRLLALLLERAASTRQLAEAVERPAGTVAHHLNVLEDAGLVRVVRTRQVRAMTERYYGRTARTFVFAEPEKDDPSAPHTSHWMLREALAEATAGARPGGAGGSTLRYARIPAEVADEFLGRLAALAEEFAAEPRSGDTTYGIIAGVFPTAWRPLAEPEPDA